MSKGCFCHFNGYEVKDAKARSDIETFNTKLADTEVYCEEYVDNACQEIKEIAEGKTNTYVFDTYESLVIAVGNDDGTTYKVGDNLYIKDVDVPDYWISEVLETNTGSVGYYNISPLETQKVDLSEYALKSELPTNTETKYLYMYSLIWKNCTIDLFTGDFSFSFNVVTTKDLAPKNMCIHLWDSTTNTGIKIPCNYSSITLMSENNLIHYQPSGYITATSGTSRFTLYFKKYINGVYDSTITVSGAPAILTDDIVDNGTIKFIL